MSNPTGITRPRGPSRVFICCLCGHPASAHRYGGGYTGRKCRFCGCCDYHDRTGTLEPTFNVRLNAPRTSYRGSRIDETEE